MPTSICLKPWSVATEPKNAASGQSSGELQGYRVLVGRSVAEKIELQTRCAAELYNVDVRHDQRHMAEQDLFPCGERGESRFSPDFEVPFSSLEIKVYGDPSMPREISWVDVLAGRSMRL